MLGFAANLTTMYAEYSFLDRFAAAARDGFEAVEYLFPYAWGPSQLSALLERHHLQQVLINAPAGDWDSGERGLGCLPGRESEFRIAIDSALEYAQTLHCPCVHVMAGIPSQDLDSSRARATYVANLGWAAEQGKLAGREILIEPINPYDMPGYFLNRQDEAHAIVAEIGLPNLKVQMDLYHCQRVEGAVDVQLRKYLGGSTDSAVGHIQVAGVPGRHEPDSGDLDFDPLFDFIENSDYAGWIGCEYLPSGGTSEGLDWLRKRR